MERLYKTKEAAELLTVSEKTVRNWLSNGTIKGVKVGGSTRIEKSEIKRMIRPLQPKGDQ